MQIKILKDEPGYVAIVERYNNLYAWGQTPEEAVKELGNVIDMMLELEQEKIFVLTLL